MRLLFVKHALAYPRMSGHDVYTFEMMKALAELGHEVSLVTVRKCQAEALAGLSLRTTWCLEDQMPDAATETIRLTGLQERFRSYWGIEPAHIAAVKAAAEHLAAEAVIVVGLEGLPFLGALQGPLRVWYPADEWVWHHLSLIKWNDRKTWTHVRPAIVKGLYERAYRSLVDRVWVVTDSERRAMRWFAGMRNVDVLPLGIDSERFRPVAGDEVPFSAVFWGRLDFEPNVQAMEWFCGQVWPRVRRDVPDARLTIVGFNPGAGMKQLAGRDGVSLAANLPDLRQEVSRHQLVVLPFVSGGGIKNKLLEAASLARPIVCTPLACNGLRGLGRGEVVSVRRPDEWSRAIVSLWKDENRRTAMGKAARKWVMANHDWRAIAREAVGSTC